MSQCRGRDGEEEHRMGCSMPTRHPIAMFLDSMERCDLGDSRDASIAKIGAVVIENEAKLCQRRVPLVRRV